MSGEMDQITLIFKGDSTAVLGKASQTNIVSGILAMLQGVEKINKDHAGSIFCTSAVWFLKDLDEIELTRTLGGIIAGLADKRGTEPEQLTAGIMDAAREFKQILEAQA